MCSYDVMSLQCVGAAGAVALPGGGGEPRAIEILDGIGRHLGAGIGTLVNIFNPELVVIGGGFAAAGDFVLDPAREVAAREGLAGAGERLRIVRAERGTVAGLIGAGLVAFDALA